MRRNKNALRYPAPKQRGKELTEMVIYMSGTISALVNLEEAQARGLVLQSKEENRNWDFPAKESWNIFRQCCNSTRLKAEIHVYPGYNFTQIERDVLAVTTAPWRIAFTVPGTKMPCGIIFRQDGLISLEQYTAHQSEAMYTSVNITAETLEGLQESYVALRRGALKPEEGLDWSATSLGDSSKGYSPEVKHIRL